MTVELREFIEQRIGEDEAWARAASAPCRFADEGAAAPDGGVRWTWAIREDWTPIVIDPALDEFVGGEANYGCRVQLITVEKWPSRGHPMSNYAATDIVEFRSTWAGHIVRHDPARVLREAAGKRQMLVWFDRLDAARLDGAWWLDPSDGEEFMALAWADHPDYRQEWTP